MNTLTGQKAILAEVRQREFEAYNQVKKSCHMVEQAQLEKAEVQVQQGLEGYARDPGFDQNTVWDSGKRKIS